MYVTSRSGTPPQVVAKLADAVAKVLAQPDIQEKFRAVYVVPKSGTKALGDIIVSDHTLWAKVVKDNNITMD